MLNRWIGIVLGAAMILANATVTLRDVLPLWLPDNAPPTDAQLLAPEQERIVQVGIFDDEEHLVGRSWTLSRRHGLGDIVTVSTTTVLNPVPLPSGILTPRARIETSLVYKHKEQRVDELGFRMYGLGFPVEFNGEAMPTGEFAYQWQVGPSRGDGLLPASAPSALGDVIRPFDRLPDLYVGQTWRVKLIDPIAQIFPNLKQDRRAFDLDALVIRVTGKETIQHQGQPVETFLVRADDGSATAWVADDGRVLRQSVNVPLLGPLILVDEPYDKNARDKAKRYVR
jgi:hypothetical protein